MTAFTRRSTHLHGCEIDAPALVPEESYEIAIHPVTAVGEYYVWFNMYMEGGGRMDTCQWCRLHRRNRWQADL